MTVEEAYNYLTSPSYCTIDCDNCSNCCDDCDVNASLNLAVKALEKQMPMKPTKNRIDYYCPRCTDKLIIVGHIGNGKNNYKHNNCFNCGQAIDWSK